MPRLLFLSENAAAENWGEQAMTHGIKRILRDTIPDLDIVTVAFSRLVRTFRRWSVWPHGLFDSAAALPRFTYSLSRRLSRVVEFFPAIVDDFDAAADQWCRGDGGPPAADFVPVLRDADVIVHNGEQQIYRNSTEGCRALFLLWLARTRLNKISCEINHTAHLTSMIPIMPGMVKRVYPQLDVVTVREPSSLDNLRALGITNATLVPDPVFYLNADDVDDARVAEWKRVVGLGRGPYFCLSPSALPMSAPRNGWGGEIVRLVERLKRVVPQAVLIAEDSRFQFFREVASATRSAFFGPEHGFADLWPLLRDASFLVSGRYHHVIMASMVGCPFVPLTTVTHKMQGVCRQLNWHLTEPHDATALSTEADAIVAEAADLMSNRELHGGHLRHSAQQLGRDAVANGFVIRDALANSAERCRR